MGLTDDNDVYEIEKNDLILLAIIGVRDTLRPGVIEAVQKCKLAGLKVRMVTGDNKVTAESIAKECGIIDSNDPNSLVLEGNEFQKLTGGAVCKNCRTQKCDCPKSEIEARILKRKVRVDTILNGAEFDKIIQHLDVLARSRPEDKYALVTGLRER